jgi:acyl dehydratase
MEPSMSDYQPRGRYFEDCTPGLTITSAGRTVGEADILQFAGLSGDWNAIHIDAEYAKTSMFGERVAHGLLGLSIASGLAMQLGLLDRTVEAFTSLDWKFRAPIKIGDTIHITIEVVKTRAMSSGGGFVTFNVVVKNQRDETVQKGEWMIVVKGRPKID